MRLPDGPLDARLAAVTYGYAGTKVLDEVSLRIDADESVAIVGPTGVGKSTLASCSFVWTTPTKVRC